MRKQQIKLLSLLCVFAIFVVACTTPAVEEPVTTEEEAAVTEETAAVEEETAAMEEEADTTEETEVMEEEVAAESSEAEDPTPALDEVTLVAWSPFPAPTAREDNTYLQKIEADLGVQIDFQFAPKDEYPQRLATVLASGDIPDIVVGSPHRWPIMLPAVQQGAFINLGAEGYFDDFSDFPGLSTLPDYAWANSAVNGENFGIPQAAQQYHQGSFIRMDWLEALGMEVPTTTDELTAVLTAFASQDPDGNGEDDTIGFTLTSARANDEWNTFLEPFGVPNKWGVNDDGTLVHADVTDEMRAAITYMSELYAAGVFNPDFPSMNFSEGRSEFASGISGGYSNNFATGYDLDGAQLRDVVSGAVIYPITPVVAAGYERVTYERIGLNEAIFINAKYAGQDDVVRDLLKVIDYWFDPATDQFVNFGFEGEQHTVNEDGSLTQTDQGKADIAWVRAWGPRHYRAYVDAPYVQPDTKQVIVDDTHRMLEFAVPNPTWGLYPELGADDPTLALTEYATTTFIQMITGEKSLDEWDAYVEEWYSRGGENLTNAMNAAFEQ